jgi:hypothetical protein
MELRDYDEIPLCKILHSVRVTRLLAKQIDWDAQQIKNSRSAWFALCAHPTHTDADTCVSAE